MLPSVQEIIKRLLPTVFVASWLQTFERNLSVNEHCGSVGTAGLFSPVHVGQKTCRPPKGVTFDLLWSVFFIPAGYPSLRIEKNDLRSVTLLEAKAKVKDIAISRERVTLRDVLHEGTCFLSSHLILSSLIFFPLTSLERRSYCCTSIRPE